MSSYKICKFCGEYEHDCNCAAAKAIAKLKEKIVELEKWKNEDPRMLREQIRVSDLAFNRLNEENKRLQEGYVLVIQELILDGWDDYKIQISDEDDGIRKVRELTLNGPRKYRLIRRREELIFPKEAVDLHFSEEVVALGEELLTTQIQEFVREHEDLKPPHENH